MVSEEHYDRPMDKSSQPKRIVQFFRESPLVGIALDLDRDPDAGREVDMSGVLLELPLKNS